MNTLSQCKGQTCFKSLFDLCIELVAESLDLVESFCGFPSLIGEKIFKTAVEYDTFSDYSKSRVALELFTEAFGAEIVSSLNLSQQHLGLNFFLEQFLLFSELVEIDLSFCGLGDHHEILAHIATMRSLQKLVLCKNALSDQGIQKLTTPHRMFQNGPRHLSHLDLNGNDVSIKCLKFLTSFNDLDSVILPCPQNDATQYDGKWKLIEQDYGPVQILTRGWASDVIDKWMLQARSRQKTRQPNRKPFYSRSVLKEIDLERKLNTEQDQSTLSLCLLATRTNKERCTGAKNGVRTAKSNDIKDKTVTNDCDSFIKQDSENNRNTGTTGYETNVFDTELLQLYSYDKSDGEHNTKDSVPDKPDSVPDKPDSVPDKPDSVPDKSDNVPDKPDKVRGHGNQAEYDSELSLLRRLDSHTHNPKSKSRLRNDRRVNSQEFSEFGGSGSAVVKPISLRMAKTPRSFGRSGCNSVNTSKSFSETGCTNSKYAKDFSETGHTNSKYAKDFSETGHINSKYAKDFSETGHTNSKYAAQSKTMKTVLGGKEDGRKEQSRKRKWFIINSVSTKDHIASPHTNKSKMARFTSSHEAIKKQCVSSQTNELSKSCDKLSQTCDIRSQSCDRLSQSCDRLSQSCDKLSQSSGSKNLKSCQGSIETEYSVSEANDDEHLRRLFKKKRKIIIYTPKESEKQPVVKKDSLVKSDKPKISKLLEALDY